MIIEDNTILYSIKMKGVNDDNYLKKKNRIQLKKELVELYIAQNDILPKTNIEKKKLNKEELKNIKKEDKINNMFSDAKDYFWRTLLNSKKMDMKIKTFGNLNDINKNYNNYNNYNNNNYNKSFWNKKNLGKINLKKMSTADFSSNKSKSKTRNTSFRYLTSINKISKEHSINISFPEKEEESKKSLKNTNDTFKSLKSEKLLLKLFSNNLSDNSINKKNTIPIKSNIGLYKENIFRTKYLKDKKYKTLKYFNHFNNLNEEKKLENNFNNIYSLDNNNKNNHTNNTIVKYYSSIKNNKNVSTSPKNRIKLTKNVIDKYIIKMAKLSNENKVNYNSGTFKIPLIGLKP